MIGIGIDFTACTMMPALADGTPLCRVPQWRNNPHAWVKLWKHHAAQPEADRVNELAAERGEKWLPRYGGRISSEWQFAKALQVLEEDPEIYAAADRWIAERRAAGLPPLMIGVAAASGRVVFGAVGDGERLEFTVIGDAVNFAAKLEKHNKDEKTRAVTDGATYALAEQQGYVPPAGRERREGRRVGGVTDLVDIVVLAA